MYTVRSYRDVMFNKNKTYSPAAKIPITENIQKLYYVEVSLLNTLLKYINKEKE